MQERGSLGTAKRYGSGGSRASAPALVVGLVGVAMAVLLAACGTDAPADDGELTEITIILGFTASPEYAAVFAAVEEGYFAEEGLDVTILQGGGVDPTSLVGTRQVDFLFGSMDGLPAAVESGLPLRAIAARSAVNVFGLVVAEGSGIERPEDLHGRRIGLPAAGASRFLFTPFAAANDLNEDEIEVITVTGRASIAALLAGEVDAAGAGHANLVRVREEQPGAGFIAYAEWGVPVIGQGLVGHTNVIEQQPELVASVVRAFIRGIEFSVADPETATEYVGRYFEEAVTAYEDPVEVLRATNELVTEPYGYMPPEVWQETVDVMVEYGELSDPRPAEEYYTNEFLPDR
jgi:NitT/TauT family transport system substrate-binding protein